MGNATVADPQFAVFLALISIHFLNTWRFFHFALVAISKFSSNARFVEFFCTVGTRMHNFPHVCPACIGSRAALHSSLFVHCNYTRRCGPFSPAPQRALYAKTATVIISCVRHTTTLYVHRPDHSQLASGVSYTYIYRSLRCDCCQNDVRIVIR